MKIFVTKNLFQISIYNFGGLLLVLILSFLFCGCTGGKMPPQPEDPDGQNYGGTTNEGYVEPMFPLSDAGVFPKDNLTQPTNKPDAENNNSNNINNNIDKNKDKDKGDKTTPDAPPVTTPEIKKIPETSETNVKTADNMVVLFGIGGGEELYFRQVNFSDCVMDESGVSVTAGSLSAKDGVKVKANLGSGLLLMPVSDLVDQVDEYILRIGENLDDLKTSENYSADGDSIYRDASGLALVALSIGLYGKESRYWRAAPELISAAKRLIAATDYEVALSEFSAIKTALKSNGEPDKLKLEKIVKLKPVMKAMPNLNSNVRRLTNTETKLKRQLGKKPKQIFGQLAALAAISECSIPNGDETLKPNELEKWRRECEQFRDAAIKANIAAHDFADGKIKYENYWSAFNNLSRSCDSCHSAFYPNALEQ
ncbi:MAG: hypothetical protein LBP59_09600 [Planctomycetaceae bacterium]|jgi:hypothetical protein|nr:hypothetical protein [Planctomycetaceae bacterium]